MRHWHRTPQAAAAAEEEATNEAEETAAEAAQLRRRLDASEATGAELSHRAEQLAGLVGSSA